MCTAICYQTKEHYFGRTLDLEYSYDERVVISPRNYPFRFRAVSSLNTHYAILGIAHISEGYPLYYDAVNEYGLSMAALHFPGNAVYKPKITGCDNLAPFELLPWILGKCRTLAEARVLLTRLNLWEEDFSADFPNTPLHWILADRDSAITIEPMQDGLNIYDNPVGVLTNNPPFPFHLHHLSQFLHLSPESPENRFAPKLALQPYARDLGAIGLPGDFSSASRFVRAAFAKWNSVSEDYEAESVSQFFHIMNTVDQPRGCCHLGDGAYMRTVYTSCYHQERGILYYTTYENRQITATALHREDLEGQALVSYPLIREEQIRWENELSNSN